MGASCDCSDNHSNQAAPNTLPKRPTKGSDNEYANTRDTNETTNIVKYSSSEPDSDTEYREYDSDEPSSKYLETEPPDPISNITKETKQKAISGYKDAVNRGNETLVMYYIDEYPEMDLLSIPFENGANCLQIAVENCSYNLIYYLLNNGVSPNDQNPQTGDTSLHAAVRTRDIKVVTLLCQYDADPAITNRKFETPLTIASDNRDDDIIELLAPDTLKKLKSIDEQAAILAKHDDLDIPTTALDAGSTNSALYHQIAEDILNADDQPYSPIPIATPDTDTAPRNGYHLAAVSENEIAGVSDGGALPETKMDNENTFERGLTDRTKLKLEAVRVANNNPFSQLKRKNTKKVLGEIQEMTANKYKLPTLEAWLEKKSGSIGKGWQKRWCVVKGSYILWSDVQRDIKNPKNIKERKKWNNCLNIMTIKEVIPVTKSKSQRKFRIVYQGGSDSKNKEKEYLWKCATKEDRDFWADGLKKHISHTKAVLAYLGTK